jgi:hypothetical protein
MAKRQRKFGAKIGGNLMKYFVFIIAIISVLSSCASNEATNITKNDANTVAPVSVTANNNSAAATNANSSEMKPYSGIQNVNANTFNAPNSNIVFTPKQAQKDQLPVGARVAADGSIINSGSRGKDFYEARTFNNHPVLAKVEKIMDGKTTKYKIYLKNGKVLDALAEKMGNFESVTPENLLEIVGMSPKSSTNQPADSEQKKETEKQSNKELKQQ